MSEEYEESSQGQARKPDCMAKRAIERWSRPEIEKVRENKPGLLQDPQRLNAYLVSKLGARALKESETGAKVLVSASYPISAFVRETGHNMEGRDQSLADGLLACLPKFIEISETWIGYKDGSVILVSTPSPETLACSRFLSEMAQSPEAGAILGITGEDLSRAQEVMQIALSDRHVCPMSNAELQERLMHKASIEYPPGATPSYAINLSKEPSSSQDLARALIQFSKNPVDTAALATNAYINALSKSSAQRREEDGRGKAAARAG